MPEKSITFVNPSFAVYAAHPSPPLGLAYLKSVVLKAGGQAEIIDQVAGMPLNVDKIGTEWVGITVYTSTSKNAYALADAFRKTGKKVVLGGPHATILPEEALQHADKVIVGEGEKSILDVFSTKERIIKNPLIENLESLPFPDWHGLPLEKYKSQIKKNPYLSVMTSRGCPFNCIFCYKGIFGRRYRMRSAQNVVGEVENLVNEYGRKEIIFSDDCITQNRPRAVEIFSEMVKRKMKLDWACGVRVDTVDAELLALMRKAGCYQIAFGIESGNQEVLNKMGKGTTLKQAEKAVKLTNQAGIETTAYLMFGLPFETRQTMQDTIDFAKSLPFDYITMTIAAPYPGTGLYEYIAKGGGRMLISNWSEFGHMTGKACFETDTLPKEVIEEMYKKANKEIYFDPKFALRSIIRHPMVLCAGLKYFSNIFKSSK